MNPIIIGAGAPPRSCLHAALGMSLILLDHRDAGGGAMPEAEFQQKMLKSVEAIDATATATKTKQDQLITDYSRLDKETKKVFEEITSLKRVANDSNANFESMVRKMETLEQRLRLEVKAAFGNPMKRISADPELRTRLNCAVRLALDKEGDMQRLIAPQLKALGEDSSPGSTLINTALAREMYDTLAMYGIWNTFAVRQVGTSTTKFPVKTARAAAGFVLTEGGQISDDSTKAGTTVSCVIEVIAVLLNVSLQLLQDAELDVTGDVMEDFAEAFAYVLDWACTRADGGADATDGGMTGIFGGGGTAVAAASGNTTVETTDEDDWRNTVLGVDAAVLSRQARWWIHPQMLVRALAVKDSNGRSIFLTALEAPTVAGIGSIFGYPVTPGHICPSTNSASGKVAVFGDPNGQVVGIRQGFTVEASDHHKWDYLQRSFRGYGRAGTKIRKATAYGVLTLAAS